jgi:hypothetical protein
LEQQFPLAKGFQVRKLSFATEGKDKENSNLLPELYRNSTRLKCLYAVDYDASYPASF